MISEKAKPVNIINKGDFLMAGLETEEGLIAITLGGIVWINGESKGPFPEFTTRLFRSKEMKECIGMKFQKLETVSEVRRKFGLQLELANLTESECEELRLLGEGKVIKQGKHSSLYWSWHLDTEMGKVDVYAGLGRPIRTHWFEEPVRGQKRYKPQTFMWRYVTRLTETVEWQFMTWIKEENGVMHDVFLERVKKNRA